ncbi:uncharacterized protein [Watersipora subatra]|uniref:uncharacterized protein n=1 Tax=Watersipora subatra TaxID=2589382 RepID=UPI00355C61D5
MADELIRNTNVEIQKQFKRLPAVLCDGTAGLHMNLVNIPTEVKFHFRIIVGKNSFSVSHFQNGDLQIGTAEGIYHQLRGESRAAYVTHLKDLRSCMQTSKHSVNYILYGKGNSYFVEEYVYGLTDTSQLFTFTVQSNILPFLTVSNQYIIVTNPDLRQVVMYDFASKKCRTCTIAPTLWVPYFLPNDELLATTGEDELRKHRKNYRRHTPYPECNSLVKYRVDDKGLTQIWSCGDLPYACGVSHDSTGLIYVSTFRNRTIYIISPCGKKLRELHSDRLPEPAGQISVHGNKLAVPDWEKGEVIIFTIN